MRILGVDPGAQGAWVVLDRYKCKIVRWGLLPHLGRGKERSVDLESLQRLYDEIGWDRIHFEVQVPFRMNSGQAFMWQGRYVGVFETLAWHWETPMHGMLAKEWQSLLPPRPPKPKDAKPNWTRLKTKEAAQTLAQRLYPECEWSDMPKVMREAVADAALIATYDPT